ncbi:MAG: hypothetical protein QOG72_380 [Sphingomonadales bacterium]|jgi:hypothetical protein|nr:hypothetical protein [Sphingomonadales bacterium]
MRRPSRAERAEGLNLHAFGKGQGVFDIDAEISDGALDLGVTKEDLRRSKAFSKKQGRLRDGPPPVVGGIIARIDADAPAPKRRGPYKKRIG